MIAELILAPEAEQDIAEGQESSAKRRRAHTCRTARPTISTPAVSKQTWHSADRPARRFLVSSRRRCNMAISAFEGIIENGRIRLPDEVTLPEQTKVYVIVPGPEKGRPVHIRSPRLAHP